ncbi:hypothetical protein JIP62_02615 [Brevundimonas vitis]|jgi:hypothetical protein|uniref:Uncharacterized protein n=1 Tax=Brevundimonas vitisensis TaxID=2800818 RepID=A0ABX7BN78_9CAUL|nr:hypothetical protein [Brevundimonas vitisensis]QQQ19042.1 hypothetical protein JIP62_02615 [Brevundimonas vitisensis]
MTQSDRFAHIGFAARRRPSGLMAPLMWLGGATAAVIAMAVGALLAVFAAAAVAVIAVVGAMLIFLTGFAMRARRALAPRGRRSDDVIEARKIDGAWVTYGWERHGRS